jgi:hypothetical protein
MLWHKKFDKYLKKELAKFSLIYTRGKKKILFFLGPENQQNVFQRKTLFNLKGQKKFKYVAIASI